MPEEKEKKSTLWNSLLTIMIIAVACLIAVMIYLFVNRQKELDLSMAYVPPGLESAEYTLADPFAKDLVISDLSVTIDDVKLDSTTEKGLLFDIDHKTSLFAQGVYDKAYPASITKLMTVILAAKYGNMSDVIIMEESDFDLEEGSQVSGLLPGDQVTLEQLFYALVVYSANDAAMAIARHIDGSVSNFVAHMNSEAHKLGMKNSHFMNPHGLHDKDHYTCAYDIYLMLNEAIKYQIYLDAARLAIYRLSVQRDDLTVVLDLSSTDKYLTGDAQLPRGITILGGKTGTTDEAGSCLTLAVQNRMGVLYIAVILNAYNKEILYKDMNQLLGSIAV